MRSVLNCVFIVFIDIFLCLSTSTCATIDVYPAPHYKGVDPKAQEIVKEYKELAKIHGIKFDHEVTVGFKTIKEDDVVGQTVYGAGWREITFDTDYWDHGSSIRQLVLAFHELGHAYCTRDHDYGRNKKYPDVDKIRKDRKTKKLGKEGYYSDGCPLSLMYSIIVDDGCVLDHYQQYVMEMFDRCEPF